MSLRELPLIDGPVAFEGAVSLEALAGGAVRPWRLPYREIELFEPALIARAEQPSGVRMTLLSDTRRLEVGVEPAGAESSRWVWDLVVDGELAQRVEQSSREPDICFDRFPAGGGARRVEVYLPSQYLPVTIRSASIDTGAAAASWTDPRKRWVVYGSSITHAKEAAGPSETWPAIVAKRYDLHLTSLGYGGQEHLEPMVARMIRDLPADFISVCVGGNVWGSASLSERTYRAAVIGLVKTIRDRHPHTPLAVVSFIWTSRHETASNAHCVDIPTYRRWTADAVAALRRCGDERLHYFSGTDLFGPREAEGRLPDGVHPDAQGQRILAERYTEVVMPALLGKRTAAGTGSPSRTTA